MTLKFFFCLTGLAALACSIGFKMIGSSVDTDGFLQEPFILIPLGYLAGIMCVGGLVLLLIQKNRAA